MDKKQFAKDNNTYWDYVISVDRQQDIINNPLFDSLSIPLQGTNTLNEIADALRKTYGFEPIFSKDAEDNDAWYDFRISIERGKNLVRDNTIIFEVCNSQQEDNGEYYNMKFSDSQSEAIYTAISKQLNLDDLFKEAGGIMTV